LQPEGLLWIAIETSQRFDLIGVKTSIAEADKVAISLKRIYFVKAIYNFVDRSFESELSLRPPIQNGFGHRILSSSASVLLN
jgi:hypothetical protein